ncbi:hypothetical protein JCM10213_000777 [Rhodosporidiobolus nylandii]
MDEVILLEGESGRAKVRTRSFFPLSNFLFQVLLPPELLLPILSLAVEDEPPPSRYAILHHLCLVSHIFREIAQPLLFRCIQPATPEAWEKLAALIESHPHVRQHVRAARIGEWHAGRRWNLWCPTIDIRCLRLLPNLVSLHLPSVRVHRVPPSFPSLTRLATLISFMNPHPDDLLPLPFPSLQYWFCPNSPLVHNMRPQGFELFPRLRGLAAPFHLLDRFIRIPPPCPVLWRIPWQSFVDYMSPWRDFPSSPISLKHLHILPITYPPPPHYLCELSRCELSRRLASDPSLSTLEVLYLPTQWKGAGTEEGKEEWERVLKEKNVEVEYEDVEPFWEHEGGGMLRAFERRCEAAAGEVSEVVN